jgi:hypothetical protein
LKISQSKLNNILDSCLKATISAALSTNNNVKGVISDIINKFAQKDNGIIINLTDNLTSGSATTHVTSSSSNKFVININFNSSYFSDISKEAVVTRLIHEAVHAYLLYTDNDYINLAETEQHNYLFTNYIDEMGDYLMKKYGLDDDEAYGLAWSGTNTFDNADMEDAFLAKDGNFTSKGDLLSAFAGFLSNDALTKKGTPNCPSN